MNRRRLITAAAVVGLALAIGLVTPAGAQFVSQYLGRTFTSTAPTGANGFACRTEGCRVDLGPGVADYLYASSGVVTSGGLLSAASTITSHNGFFSAGTPASNATLRGTAADGATAIAVKVQNTNALATSGAKIAAFYSDNGITERASIDKDGTFFGAAVSVTGGLYTSGLLRFTTTTALGTCSGTIEGAARWMTGTGGTGTLARTRLCLCTSDGAASPVYAWQNIATGTVGNATTCNP